MEQPHGRVEIVRVDFDFVSADHLLCHFDVAFHLDGRVSFVVAAVDHAEADGGFVSSEELVCDELPRRKMIWKMPRRKLRSVDSSREEAGSQNQEQSER